MGESSVVSFQIGLLIMAGVALFSAGVAWASLSAKIKRSEERDRESAQTLDDHARELHKARSRHQAHDLRIALLEHRGGVPTIHAPEDLTPIREIRRTRPPRGDADESG